MRGSGDFLPIVDNESCDLLCRDADSQSFVLAFVSDRWRWGQSREGTRIMLCSSSTRGRG